MDLLLFGIYIFASFAFFPLIAIILYKFRRLYPDQFDDVKCKVITVLVLYFCVVTLRLILYVDFKHFRFIFKDPTIYSIIPFYLTEIIIAIFLSYVLFSVSKIERDSEISLDNEEITRKLMEDMSIHMNDSNAIINKSMKSIKLSDEDLLKSVRLSKESVLAQ